MIGGGERKEQCRSGNVCKGKRVEWKEIAIVRLTGKGEESE